MTKTRTVPVVVYGLSAPGAKLEHVTALDERRCQLLPGLETDAVVMAVIQAVKTR